MYRAIALGVLGLAAAGLGLATAAADQESKAIYEMVKDQCTRCHSTARIKRETQNEKAWETTILRMIKHGAKVPEDHVKGIAAFLAKHNQNL